LDSDELLVLESGGDIIVDDIMVDGIDSDCKSSTIKTNESIKFFFVLKYSFDIVN